jgi:putative phosphoesterase
MSKIAIISDIHGNLPALDAALDDIARRGITQIYCLGDLVGYYCFFNEVVERISLLNIPTILGNHDDALVNNHGVIKHSKTCTRILKWQSEHMTTATDIFLKSIPTILEIEFGGKSIQFVHGGLVDPLNEYIFDVNDEYLRNNEFKHDVLITGHTHLISYKKFFSGNIWLNAGSVGQSRDFDNRLSYLVLNSTFDVEFVRIRYDYMKVVEAMKENGFEDYISETLISGKKIGYNNFIYAPNNK